MNLVLIITKDSAIGQAIEKAIDPSKYLVWVSYSLQEARTMLGQQNTSAIIIDAQNRIDEGLEFVETIKLKLGKLEIACIMLCAPGANIDMKKALRAGVDDVVIWPSPLENIIGKIDQLIDEYHVHQGTKLLEYREANEDSDEAYRFSEDQGIADHIPSSMDPLRFNQPGVLNHPQPEEPHFEAYEMNPNVKPQAIDLDGGDDAPKTEIYHEPKHAEDAEKISGPKSPDAQFTTEHDARRGVTPAGGVTSVEKAAEALSVERIEEIAAKILDKKLTEAARTNIRRIIAQVVREEIEKIKPDLMDSLKKK